MTPRRRSHPRLGGTGRAPRLPIPSPDGRSSAAGLATPVVVATALGVVLLVATRPELVGWAIVLASTPFGPLSPGSESESKSESESEFGSGFGTVQIPGVDLIDRGREALTFEDEEAAADAGGPGRGDDALGLAGVPARRETGRWGTALAAGLSVGATGVLLGNAAVLLAAAVPFTYAAYGYATRAPPLSVGVERTVDDPTPRPGAPVEVEVTVRNDTEGPIPDLRIVDGVPDRLPVTDGSPRAVVSLAAGESASFSYRVAGRRGDHRFGKLALFARSVNGAVERHATRDPDTRIRCRGGVDAIPLRGLTGQSAGRVPTDAGGEGLAFHAVRAHQPSDPMSRIDWNRFARTGELTTIQFQQERAATVVLVIDDRQSADRSRGPDEPSAVEYGAYAAEHVAAPLLARNDAVGAALLDGGAYLPPDTGRAQSLRVARLLDGAEPSGTRSIARRADGGSIRRHLPDHAQVALFTPLLDDQAVETADLFEAHGHPVTLISPDVTGDTPGGRLAGLDRAGRVRSLREGRVRVVDWSPTEPLRAAVERDSRGWSR